MNTRENALLDATLALARDVPESTVRAIAGRIEMHADGCTVKDRTAIVASVAQAPYRAAVQRFMSAWPEQAASTPPVGVAWALRAAARTLAEEHARQSVDVVLTGPNVEDMHVRRTDGALLEVIHAARETLTIVTFAAYKVPAVAEALVRAAQRGVPIRIIIESAQVSEGKIAYDALAALGPDVRRLSSAYMWPLEKRPVDDQGRHGSLHVKCAVADRSIVLVSSANLTAYALTLNMELGLLVRGGPIPARIATHLDGLIERGILMPLTHDAAR